MPRFVIKGSVSVTFGAHGRATTGLVALSSAIAILAVWGSAEPLALFGIEIQVARQGHGGYGIQAAYDDGLKGLLLRFRPCQTDCETPIDGARTEAPIGPEKAATLASITPHVAFSFLGPHSSATKRGRVVKATAASDGGKLRAKGAPRCLDAGCLEA